MQFETEAFRLEKRRLFYAKKRQISRFKSLYNASLPEIVNKNFGSLWDGHNFSRFEELHNSPIYIDKLSKVVYLLSHANGNLLDVGFGNGLLEKKLSNLNLDLNFFGIDISKKSIREIKKRIEGDFKYGDVLNIPFTSNYFNYVLCLDVLEHVSPKNTFLALSELNRVLKKDGKLILSIPLNESLENMIKNGINPNAHVRVYQPEVIKMELEISGFELKKEFYLSAFQRFYGLKNMINSLLNIKSPNLIIILAKKT